MIKVTALQNVRIAVNQVVPQHAIPLRRIPPFREQTVTLEMRAGDSREDISLVYGLVPAGESACDANSISHLAAIPHPMNVGENVEFEGKLRLEKIS